MDDSIYSLDIALASSYLQVMEFVAHSVYTIKDSFVHQDVNGAGLGMIHECVEGWEWLHYNRSQVLDTGAGVFAGKHESSQIPELLDPLKAMTEREKAVAYCCIQERFPIGPDLQ